MSQQGERVLPSPIKTKAGHPLSIIGDPYAYIDSLPQPDRFIHKMVMKWCVHEHI